MFGKRLLLLFLVVASAAWADNCPSMRVEPRPAKRRFWQKGSSERVSKPYCGAYCGTFDIGAEFLYFKPMTNPYTFVVERFSVANPSFDTFENFRAKPDYQSGGRGWVGYQRQCSYARLGYLWYESFDRTALSRSSDAVSFNVAGVGVEDDFDRAESRLLFRYQNIDGQIAQSVIRNRGCELELFGNIRWAQIQRKSRTFAESGQEVEGFFEQVGRFTGAGLGVGMAGRFAIRCDIDAVGQLNAMGLIGRRSVPVSLRSDMGFVENTYPSDTCVIPALDFRLGLRASRSRGCNTFSVELGYEVNYYWNALEFAPDPEVSQSFLLCQDIGFAGPYFQINIGF